MTVELVRAAAQDADVLFAARVSPKGEHSLTTSTVMPVARRASSTI